VLLNLASQMNPARQLKPASHLRLAGFSGCVLSSAVLSHARQGTARQRVAPAPGLRHQFLRRLPCGVIDWTRRHRRVRV
jgi:hypothetical protein